jgi:hypothetical protein
VGANPAVAIGGDGLPVIAYHDHSNSDIKVAHCRDADCTDASVVTLDAQGSVGWHIDVAVGRDGLPVVVYYDETNGDLKVAHCADAGCTRAPRPAPPFSGA